MNSAHFFLILASILSCGTSGFFWIHLYRFGIYEIVKKANRWALISLLIALLVLFTFDQKSEELIYFVFFNGLSFATSFSLSLFAEENQFQRWHVIWAQILILAATILSGLELAFQ